MAVQIHCIDTKGNRFVMNRFSGENAEAYHDKTKTDALRNHARRMAGEWFKVYPHDNFVVVDV